MHTREKFLLIRRIKICKIEARHANRFQIKRVAIYESRLAKAANDDLFSMRGGKADDSTTSVRYGTLTTATATIGNARKIG